MTLQDVADALTDATGAAEKLPESPERDRLIDLLDATYRNLAAASEDLMGALGEIQDINRELLTEVASL